MHDYVIPYNDINFDCSYSTTRIHGKDQLHNNAWKNAQTWRWVNTKLSGPHYILGGSNSIF